MNKKKRSWLPVLLLLYAAMLIYCMLLGFGRDAQTEYRYNIIPFATIHQFVTHLTPYNLVINICGNIMTFIPAGLLLSAFCAKNTCRALAFFLAGLLILEMLQFFLKRGSFDVDDIILNTMGFLLGAVLYRTVAGRSG